MNAVSSIARLALVFVFMSVVLAGCSGRKPDPEPPLAAHPDRMRAPIPRLGRGPRYRPPPSSGGLAAGEPIDGMLCRADAGRRFGAHLEIFARGLDLMIPAGVGIAPPRVRDGAYVRAGRCSYPVRTLEPTGLIEVEVGSRPKLGDFFKLWNQPLSRTRLVGFRSPPGERVSAYVNGRRWAGDPRAIPLARHTAIVLEVGGYFPPTRVYAFPPKL
jgi:hypothetical protein